MIADLCWSSCKGCFEILDVFLLSSLAFEATLLLESHESSEHYAKSSTTGFLVSPPNLMLENDPNILVFYLREVLSNAVKLLKSIEQFLILMKEFLWSDMALISSESNYYFKMDFGKWKEAVFWLIEGINDDFELLLN